MTKTERILSYLPPTFKALPRPTALYSVVDAFGTQLLEAENGLGAVMRAHWVDFADRGSDFIEDLNCFGALYGLAPRDAAYDVVQFATATCPPVSADETVEEFREHLKRYVRTFIEGTVTVQGVLRIVAESLALHIEDDYAGMDTWWSRESDALTTSGPAAGSVARQLFGTPFLSARGAAARPAQAIGKVSLNKIALGRSSILRLRVDDRDPVEIDLVSATTLPKVISAINNRLSVQVARDAGGRLKLVSPTVGAKSRLEVMDVSRDAAPALLGLLPRTVAGKAGAAARLTGRIDLSRGVELKAQSRIQLRIDGGSPITVNLGGYSKTKVGIARIVDAINHAAGSGVAHHDGKHITLLSPTTGVASGVSLVDAGPCDVAESILGIAPRSFHGADARPARVVSSADLSGGFDLRSQHLLQVSVDGGRPVVVDLWDIGGDLKAVSPAKIRNALNREFGQGIASDDGRKLFLTSTITGPASSIAVSPVMETQARRFVTRAFITDEAAPIIFGFLRKSAVGKAATPARLEGSVDLSSGVDLRNHRTLKIAVDNRPPSTVDLAKGIPILRGATLPEIAATINEQAGQDLATHDGGHLILTASTQGAGSNLSLEPAGADDARQVLFGAGHFTAQGNDPAPATIRGEVDLHQPVNLSVRHILRLAINNQPPLDVDVAGAAPNATFLDEIVDAINRVLPGVASATADDRLLLTSPQAGESSTLELLPLRALEVMEYPPTPVEEPIREVQHGDSWSITNDGAAASDLEISIAAPHGESGVQFVNRSSNARLRVLDAVLPGETMVIRRAGGTGVQVEITDPEGTVRQVPDSNVLAGTIGAEVTIPFEGQRGLTVGLDHVLSLQLNDPSAPAAAILRAVVQPEEGEQILVNVSPAATAAGKIDLRAGFRRVSGKVRTEAGATYLLDKTGKPILRLLPGPGVTFAPHGVGQLAVSGVVHVERDKLPVMLAEASGPLFDVTVQLASPGQMPLTETYRGVTIGRGATPESLPLALLSRPSQLVRAEEMDKADLLSLPRGKMELTYMNSHASRFDEVRFASRPLIDPANPPKADVAQFVGGSSREWALFETSRFSDATPTTETSFFSPPERDSSVQVGLRWTRYQPGAFEVNLPAELGDAFGARFDQSRFGISGQKPETYNGVVTEPDTDPNWLVHRINARSTLVSANRLAGPVPHGWDVMVMPFEQPRVQPLTGGGGKQVARIYLAEEGVPGLIELRATTPGEWGNAVMVTSKRSGPVRFDITIGYQGSRFENARQIALAGHIPKAGEDPLPSRGMQVVRAGPVGLLRAKAAGVRVDVTRESTEVPLPDPRANRLRRSPRPGYPYLAFNGVNSYVEVPDNDRFSVSTTGELTIAAWIRPDTLTFPHDERRGYVNWLGKGEGAGKSGKQEWAFRMYNLGTPESPHRSSRIGFYVFNPWGGLGIGSYFQDDVDPNEWVHVVGAVDGTRTYIYKNGVFRKCDQYRGATDNHCGRHAFIVTPIHGTAPLRMGHVDGNSYFLGAMSEVRFWDRLLTQKEIAGLYGSNRVPRDGLVAEYLLNEGRGEVAHDTVADDDALIFGAKWK